MVKHLISRREFIQKTVYGLGGLTIMDRNIFQEGKTDPAGQPYHQYLPLTFIRSALPRGEVFHVHSTSATNWDYNPSTYYGAMQSQGVKGVNQDVINVMVDRGITTLAGLPADKITEAWYLLIPEYAAGQQIAIKVNLNNSFSLNASGPALDAIIQPINAVVRGLVSRGVRPQDIIVFDAARVVPDRFVEGCLYDILFKDIGVRSPAGFSSNDPNAVVQFSPPSGTVPQVRITDVLVNAAYVINMPLLKKHGPVGVTMSFKSHLGSTNNPSGMHDFITLSYAYIDRYNALVDLYDNPHIRSKTILTIGDGIYGGLVQWDTSPSPWQTFENQAPASLFFSTDPVSIDCVMADYIQAEVGLAPHTDFYLQQAAARGMGIFERGNPWLQPYGSGYSKIRYQRIEI